jgi:hypothetical protein
MNLVSENRLTKPVHARSEHRRRRTIAWPQRRHAPLPVLGVGDRDVGAAFDQGGKLGQSRHWQADDAPKIAMKDGWRRLELAHDPAG